MPRGGHNAKPRQLKILEGTYRRDRDRGGSGWAATRVGPEIPEHLAWLSPEAKEEWARVAPWLVQNGLLTVLDRQLFAVYCETVGMYRQCQPIIERDGLVVDTPRGRRPHPLLRVVARCQQDIRAIAAQFGLTPSSRARLGAPALPTADLDDWQRFTPEED